MKYKLVIDDRTSLIEADDVDLEPGIDDGMYLNFLQYLPGNLWKREHWRTVAVIQIPKGSRYKITNAGIA